MKSKTGINLTRQTITRFWQYNIYVQKPFNVGLSFIQIFKICYLVEIFLVVFRTLKLKSRNLQIIRNLKNKLHHMYEISSYKIINFRFNVKNKKVFLFCNIGSRSLMYPTVPFLYNYKHVLELLKKKLKQFKYNFLLLNYRSYMLYFYKIVNYNKNNFFKKLSFIKTGLFFKFKYMQKLYLKKKIKLLNNKQNFILKEFDKSEWNRWFFDTKILQRIILRSYTRYSKQFLQNLKYKKIKFKNFKNSINLKKWEFLVFNKVLLKKKKKLKIFFFIKINDVKSRLKKKFFKQFYFFFYRFSFLRIFGFRLLKKYKINFNKKKKNFINPLKFLKIKRLKKNLIKNFFIFNKLNIMNRSSSKFLLVLNFWYIQIFNKFFENQFYYFIKKININIKLDIFFQQEFSVPQANYYLKLFNKRLLLATSFLKYNKKFYNNFINIMPIIQNFQALHILSKQFASELSRTKKHWRVFRGIELILMQSFVQFKKEPIENNSMFSGFYILIKGRPEKSSRTQKISLKFGQIKPSEFNRYNIFGSFSHSSSHVGSFGINVIAAT